MDNLALDAKMALQAGMSYGRWKATKPVTKEKEKLTDVSGMIKRECKNCGTVFYTRRNNKTANECARSAPKIDEIKCRIFRITPQR